MPDVHTYEMTFLSDTEKRSKNTSGQDYEATHAYHLAKIAPDIYHLTWAADEFSMAIAINFQTQKIFGFFSSEEFSNVLEGTITEVTV